MEGKRETSLEERQRKDAEIAKDNLYRQRRLGDVARPEPVPAPAPARTSAAKKTTAAKTKTTAAKTKTSSSKRKTASSRKKTK